MRAPSGRNGWNGCFSMFIISANIILYFLARNAVKIWIYHNFSPILHSNQQEYGTHNEGKPGDGVAALRVGNLRIYCLLIGRIAVVLGSGGYKPPDINVYQEDDLLNEKAEQMIGYARQINKKITDRDITITPDGKLIINNWED